MLRRWIVHLEWHPGYRPYFSIRRAPRHSDRFTNGDELGTLVRCSHCGDGFLFRPDAMPAPSATPGGP